MRALAATLAIVLAGGAAFGLAPSASASWGGTGDGCQRSEWQQVHRGDSLAKAQREIGGKGHTEWKIGATTYRTWGKYPQPTCAIEFDHGQVSQKVYWSAGS